MNLLLRDPARSASFQVRKLVLSALSSGFVPILVTGQAGFPFLSLFQEGKAMGIPVSVLGNLLQVQAVNFYHLEEIIDSCYSICQKDRRTFPLFVDFARHYDEEGFPDSLPQFLFERDLQSILTHSARLGLPALFLQNGFPEPQSRHAHFSGNLYSRCGLVLDLHSSSAVVRKNLLSYEQRSQLYGHSDSHLLRLFGRLVSGMATLPQGTSQGGSGLLRGVLSDCEPEHPSGQLPGKSLPDGNSLPYGSSGTS